MRSLLSVSLLSAQIAGTIFETDLWPGEGRPVFEAVAAALTLRERATSESAVVVTRAVKPRERLVFDDTLVRTVKPGRFVALRAAGVTGRGLGSIRRLSRADY